MKRSFRFMNKGIKSLALLAAALVLSACATKPNTQVLSKAFENQKYKVVEKQIEAGVDINAPADEAGNTVLQQAILRGDSKAFEYLVASSANPFVRNKNNQTAVDLALNSSSDYFISWAKAASQESNGSNAYKQAIQAINNNDAETLKTLLQSLIRIA
ncbi:MAG: ankyrin repeat domain-containing protein [Venatoribacter sp.]